MKSFDWDPDKNTLLRTERGVSFEEIVFHILTGDLLEVYEHPNQQTYPGQKIFKILMNGYVYLVPFVESEETVFLKTIIPSRKATRLYQSDRNQGSRQDLNENNRTKGDMKDIKQTENNIDLDTEEEEILRAFDADTLNPVKASSNKLELYQQYADATFRKDARINIRLSTRDLKGLQKRALAEGIPYQTLIASVLHKYVEGRLQER